MSAFPSDHVVDAAPTLYQRRQLQHDGPGLFCTAVEHRPEPGTYRAGRCPCERQHLTSTRRTLLTIASDGVMPVVTYAMYQAFVPVCAKLQRASAPALPVKSHTLSHRIPKLALGKTFAGGRWLSAGSGIGYQTELISFDWLLLPPNRFPYPRWFCFCCRVSCSQLRRVNKSRVSWDVVWSKKLKTY